MRTKKENIILVGGGGHAGVVADAIRKAKKFNLCGVVDPNLPKGSAIFGTTVLGADDILPAVFKKGIRRAFIGVGSIRDCGIRKKIHENLKRIGFELPVVIHPNAIVAGDVLFQEGAFIAAGAVINPGVRIGRDAIINTSSSVDHDCVIGDFVHIAPGVTLSGAVNVGDETHIGTGASVIQCVNIGKKCLIGAGTTVCHDMPDGAKNV